jgi:simple sugar transport system permease protein
VSTVELRGLLTDRTVVRPKRVAIVGIAVGVLAGWLALPPEHYRSPAVPIVLGAVAVVLGGIGVAAGARRVGYGAVAAGIIGLALGLLFQHSSIANLEAVFGGGTNGSPWGTLLQSTLRYATPLTFAALGGMISERSGVVNIGLEGMMLAGAFFGIWGADKTGNWIAGVLIAMLAGGLFALVHAIWAIHLRADQIVGGTAINFLSLGLTGYLFIQIYGSGGNPNLSNGHWVTGGQIPDVTISNSNNFFAQVFGQMNLMTWISFVVLILTYVLLFKTSIGLRIRACGEHPRAADTVGIDVYKVRYASVVASGMLAAMGGAYLTVGFTHSFSENITEGRGFIALAAMIFGKWRPFGAFAACLLFGFSTALAYAIPSAYASASSSVLRSSALPQALPYVLTLIAVAGVIGRSIPPAADGRPYKRQ